MAMVDVVSLLPIGGLMAQVGWLSINVGSHLALFCVHRLKPFCPCLSLFAIPMFLF